MLALVIALVAGSGQALATCATNCIQGAVQTAVSQKESFDDFVAEMMLEACQVHGETYEKTICLEPYFAEITKKESATAAVARAQEMAHQGEISDCHLIAHFVGEANLEKHGNDLAQTLATCSEDCIQGCIHGAVQTYVSQKDSFEAFIAELDTLCDGVSEDPLLRRQCVHGVGHGFLTGGFLPLDQAIAACGRFQGKEINTCLGGLFMEHMQGYLHLSESELTAEIPSICTEVVAMDNDTLTWFCHNAIGEGLMFYTAHDLRKSLGLCGGLADRPRDLCMEAAIWEAENAPLRFDPAACALAPAHHRDTCLELLPG
jgi:hypothetical protein